MRPERYHADDLVRLLRSNKVAALDELKAALGTEADATVFRKLAALDYRTSYSHRGRYYALDEVCRFDELGLWSFRQVWFSRFGTLLDTAAALVEGSDAGYSTAELEEVLHVDPKAALLHLVRSESLVREELAGRYVYLSADASDRRGQRAQRRIADATPDALGPRGGLRLLPKELKAAIVLFYSLLDEQERRLYAGLEAMKVGHGGDAQVAELLGLDPATVARGRRELMGGDVVRGGARRPGGGRSPKAPRK